MIRNVSLQLLVIMQWGQSVTVTVVVLKLCEKQGFGGDILLIGPTVQ